MSLAQQQRVCSKHVTSTDVYQMATGDKPIDTWPIYSLDCVML